MEIILGICTLLGGAAALWYFWDRWFDKDKERKDYSDSYSNNVFSISHNIQHSSSDKPVKKDDKEEPEKDIPSESTKIKDALNTTNKPVVAETPPEAIKSKVYCRRCGAQPGEKSTCVGTYYDHLFLGSKSIR